MELDLITTQYKDFFLHFLSNEALATLKRLSTTVVGIKIPK